MSPSVECPNCGFIGCPICYGGTTVRPSGFCYYCRNDHHTACLGNPIMPCYCPCESGGNSDRAEGEAK